MHCHKDQFDGTEFISITLEALVVFMQPSCHAAPLNNFAYGKFGKFCRFPWTSKAERFFSFRGTPCRAPHWDITPDRRDRLALSHPYHQSPIA